MFYKISIQVLGKKNKKHKFYPKCNKFEGCSNSYSPTNCFRGQPNVVRGPIDFAGLLNLGSINVINHKCIDLIIGAFWLFIYSAYMAHIKIYDCAISPIVDNIILNRYIRGTGT